jgi:phage terminase large subunit-like protein
MIGPMEGVDPEILARARARIKLERLEAARRLGLWIERSPIGRSIPRELGSIFDLFDRIRSGEQVRAIIALPPRSYKTTTCFFGAVREMEQRQGFAYGYVTSTMQTARKQSADCRRFAEQHGLWPTEEQLKKDSRFDDSLSLAHWSTNNGSSAEFMGLGNIATGRGYNLLQVDDPIKDEAEAENPAELDRIWRDITRTVVPRLNPGASFILSHHRWSQEDPIGRMLVMIENGFPGFPDEVRAELEAHPWTVVERPAIAVQVGEDLKPDLHSAPLMIDESWSTQGPTGQQHRWYSRSELLQMIATLGEDAFNARFQQRPGRSGSLLFPNILPNWLPERDPTGEPIGHIFAGEWVELPQNCRKKFFVFGSDTASSTASTANYTVVVLLACEWCWDDESEIYLLEADIVSVWHDRIDTTDVVDYVAQIVRDLPEAPLAFEKMGEGRAHFGYLARDNPDLRIEGVVSSKSKRARATPLATGGKTGRLRIPLKAAWLPELRRQMNAFTGYGGATEDDIIDALAHAWNLASLQPKPFRLPAPARERRTRGKTGAF